MPRKTNILSLTEGVILAFAISLLIFSIYDLTISWLGTPLKVLIVSLSIILIIIVLTRRTWRGTSKTIIKRFR